MTLRARIESLFQAHVAELTACEEFLKLDGGTADRAAYDRFLGNVVRAHMKSPKILAFLYAIAPPDATADLLHNMLEELGIEEESGQSHPALLADLAREAGLGDVLPTLEVLSAEDIRQLVVEPLLYGTLKEVGLAVLCEVVAFEYMLSRTASRIARALTAHRGLTQDKLEWFTHHSEVDIAHAEQGLDSLVDYVAFYELTEADAMTIMEMALRENVFIKRYFGELPLAATRGMLTP